MSEPDNNNQERKLWQHPAALVAGALFLRYACHSIMLLVVLVAERRPAPTLPDAILDFVPKIHWIDRYNYHIWLLFYIPPAVVFGFRHFKPFLRFLVAGAWCRFYEDSASCSPVSDRCTVPM